MYDRWDHRHDLFIALIDITFSFLANSTKTVKNTIDGKVKFVIPLVTILHGEKSFNFLIDVNHLGIECANLNG